MLPLVGGIAGNIMHGAVFRRSLYTEIVNITRRKYSVFLCFAIERGEWRVVGWAGSVSLIAEEVEIPGSLCLTKKRIIFCISG